MTMIKCAECGAEVSTKAKTCLRCGAPPFPKRSRWRPLLWFLGAATLFGVAVQAAFHEREAQRNASLPPAEQASAAAARERQTRRSALALTLAQTIKKAAKDPDSVKFVAMRVNEGATVACAEYRGKNSFGALVEAFSVAVDGVVSTDDRNTWNKHCTKSMYDHKAILR